MNKVAGIVFAGALAVCGCASYEPVAAERPDERDAFIEARSAFVAVREKYATDSAEYRAAWERYLEARDAYRRGAMPSVKSARRPLKAKRPGVPKLKASAQKVSATPYQVMSKRQAAFFKNRRIARTRDVTTIPGSVIVHYERNGKPDGVTTNVLQSITGAAQSNAVQEELKAKNAELNAMWDEYLTIYGELYGQ